MSIQGLKEERRKELSIISDTLYKAAQFGDDLDDYEKEIMSLCEGNDEYEAALADAEKKISDLQQAVDNLNDTIIDLQSQILPGKEQI